VDPGIVERLIEPAIYHRAGEGWMLWVPCPHCGGHPLGLGPKAAGGKRLARTRGEAFLLYVRGRFCLGCRARAWREDPFTPLDGRSLLWWDTVTSEWMAWLPLPGSTEGVSLPLGVRSFWEKPRAKAAARGLWEARMPLAIATGANAVARHMATIWHDGEEARWRLWCPCVECGGVDLGLSVAERGAVGAACSRALGALERIVEVGCPQCIAIDEKAGAAPPQGIEPRLWYDTDAREWMLTRRIEGSEEALVLPLGVGHFDAEGRELMQASLHFFDDDLFREEDPL
jgi:hypothetical protein